jgi:hypothetical protein
LRRAAVAAFLLAFSAAAGAEPFHVTYRVERHRLRTHLAAGQLLSVGVYADPLCTDAIATFALPVEDPLLVFEKVERIFARGARPRPPALASVRAIVDLDAPPGPLFAQVTGDAIRAAGGDCQAQSGLTGPAGPPGATGAEGPQGIVGATGPQGATGATGLQGDMGATGVAGATGATGAAGAPGATGPKGDDNVLGVYPLTGDLGTLPARSTVVPVMSMLQSVVVALDDPPYKLVGSATASWRFHIGPYGALGVFQFGFCYRPSGSTAEPTPFATTEFDTPSQGWYVSNIGLTPVIESATTG